LDGHVNIYEPKSIENLNKIVSVFQRLNKYFSDKTKAVIEGFVQNLSGYTDEQIDYLREIKDQIDRLSVKFRNAQNIGFQSFKDVDKVIEGLKTLNIDPAMYNHLQSDSTLKKIDVINTSIDNLLRTAGELQGKINVQKTLIERLVNEHSREINSFLRNAGYKYKVSLSEGDDGKYRLKLSHADLQDEVANVKTHLSFGERNAFALVLFMYDVLKSKPSLIVLDDPISSFDKNKKYAIVDLLFRKEKCLKGKTVLLLTHDFEPIVDMVYHHTDKFDRPVAFFLENSHGTMTEKPISKENIRPFIDINKQNIAATTHALNRMIYLRRLFEITNEKGMGYQLISNLLHKRQTPLLLEEPPRAMTAQEVATGELEIRTYISDFDYKATLTVVKDDKALKELYSSLSSNYEKLHVYRIIFDDKTDAIESDVVKKFINESFHVENDYIYQLNPSSYQTVPQYVIDECDTFVYGL
jgi:hypothetical protein